MPNTDMVDPTTAKGMLANVRMSDFFQGIWTSNFAGRSFNYWLSFLVSILVDQATVFLTNWLWNWWNDRDDPSCGRIHGVRYGALSPSGTPQLLSTKFNTNQTPDNKEFGYNARRLASGKSSGTFDVLLTNPPPPVACLFTKPQYCGDVLFLGPEEGMWPLLKFWRCRVAAFGGGGESAWIYAVAYGDAGGQNVTVSVPILLLRDQG